MISKLKFGALIFISVLLIIFWNSPFLFPLKLFVVYLHEISHAMAVMLTGGKLENIQIFLNESGYVQAKGGNFFLIAIAGYIGSIFWGSLMLYSGLTGKAHQIMSVFIASLLFFFSIYPLIHFSGMPSLLPFILGIILGGILLFSSFWSYRLNRGILFFFGSLTSLYGVFDLNDFFSGRIMETDAGILASHYFQNPLLRNVTAYLLAVLISALSLYIFIRILRSSLSQDDPPYEGSGSPPSPNSEIIEYLEKNYELKRKNHD